MKPATRLARSAYRRICRVNDLIDRAKDRRDPVALADARTAMNDARCAYAAAHGYNNADRNGYIR